MPFSSMARWFRERIQTLRQPVRRRSYGLDLAVTGALALALALAVTAGGYLNTYLFINPVLRLRQQVGLQPALDPRIRMVLLEDRSLQRLGRTPTFGDWYRVAKLLFAEGYSTVLLLGMHTLPSELGDMGPRHTRGTFAAGAVVVNGSENLRTIDASTLPDRLLFRGTPPAAPAPETIAVQAMAPYPPMLSVVDRLGNLNAAQGLAIPAAYVTPRGFILPNMGLLVADHLTWNGDAPRDERGEIPVFEDGTLFADMVDGSQVARQATPISAFFDPALKEVRAESYPELSARLAGGQVGILVPDAYTGTRFIEAPTGRTPAYLAVVSIANSVLTHAFLRQLGASRWILGCGTLALLLLLRSRRSSRVLIAASIATAAVAAASVGIFLATGLILPCAQLVVIASTGLVARALCHLVFLAGEKTALRKDLEMGRAIQTLLLPRATDGRIGPWEYRIIYRPYGPMSGDWFQVHATPEAGGRSLIAIGDVVGKGPSAALNTAVVASIWRTWEARWRRGDGDVAAFAQALHEAIALAFHGEQFSTLSLCELTDDAIRMVAAAAPRWVYLSAEDGPVQAHVSAAGNPLGIAPVDGGPFPPMDVWAVAPKVGDIFVAYTDGVLDRFGRSLLMRSVRERPPTGPLGFGELEDLVIEAAGPQGQEDDFTLMMVRYAGHGNVTELPVPASQTQLQSAS